MERADSADDAKLVDAARLGDEAAFAALYRRHKDYVAAISRRFGATETEALDVLQETFLYFLQKLPAFELRADLRTFFYPVAKHLTQKRKQQGRRTSSLDAGHPDVANRAAGPSEESQRILLEEAVAGLPEKQREVVVLRFVDGLSLDEISRALRIRLGTVKSRLHNALCALRASGGEQDR
jgi:RNA polymerase sigma-70 factor (ECF subfamily)